jgi:hypothetical protein
MHAPTGTNPEASAVTEVMWGNADETAKAGEVGLGDGEVGGEGEAAGAVEGLGHRGIILLPAPGDARAGS